MNSRISRAERPRNVVPSVGNIAISRFFNRSDVKLSNGVPASKVHPRN
jgi:hypothetical protein